MHQECSRCLIDRADFMGGWGNHPSNFSKVGQESWFLTEVGQKVDLNEKKKIVIYYLFLDIYDQKLIKKWLKSDQLLIILYFVWYSLIFLYSWIWKGDR